MKKMLSITRIILFAVIIGVLVLPLGVSAESERWYSPTSHNASTQWSDPADAYDQDMETFAYYECTEDGWIPYIEFIMPQTINSTQLRAHIYTEGEDVPLTLDIYVNGEWIVIEDGDGQNTSLYDSFWFVKWIQEYQYGDNEREISRFRLRAYGHTESIFMINEIEVWGRYEENIGPLTPLIADALIDAETTYSPEWVADAIDLAVKHNKRNWKYAEGILKRWKEEGRAEKQSGRDDQASRQHDVEDKIKKFVGGAG